MSKETLGSIIIGAILLFLLIILIYWLWVKIQTHSKKTLFNKVIDAVLLPINFGALFLENRRIEQLPFYYRWFLKFTKFTSRISYFHFLPKFIIALLAETLISFTTGQDVLTAIVFSWSILFLVIITLVEGKSGEMEEETVVFANKLFLYTVSMITLFCIIIYYFFWEGMLEEYFQSPFLQFMGEAAHWFNEMLINLWYLFLEAGIGIQIGIVAILLFYIVASVYVSKKVGK